MIRRVMIAIAFAAASASAQTVLTEQINEGANSWWTVDFRDQLDQPVTPSAASYRVQTVGTSSNAGVELVPDTAIDPLAQSVTIIVPEMIMPNVGVHNPDTPEIQQSVVTVRFCWVAAATVYCDAADAKFPLRNVPGWPSP